MRLTKLYSRALLNALPVEEALAVYYELQELIPVFDSLGSYVHRLDSQSDVFDEIRPILAEEVRPLLVNFLEILTQDGLLHRLATVTEDYKADLIEAGLLIDVKLTSAQSLSEAFKERIIHLVKNRWGEDYIAEFRVDPKLIGGVRLEVNDAVIDTSFRSRLNQIMREV